MDVSKGDKVQGVPKKTVFSVQQAVGGIRSEVKSKVGCVLENSGYFLSDEYKNFCEQMAEKNEVKHG